MSYLNSLFSLDKKVAVVTGGTGVLGSSMVKALASAGAKVAIVGRRKDVADDLAKEIKKSGGDAIGVSADVLNADQLNSAKKIILDHFGSINILVNGAGGNMPGATIPTDKTFLDLKIEFIYTFLRKLIYSNMLSQGSTDGINYIESRQFVNQKMKKFY